MKNILILLLISSFYNYNTIYDSRTLLKYGVPNQEAVAGDYYKDIHGDMDKFVGTWVYENGSTKVELIISKLIRASFGGGSGVFVDKLQIEFKYYENGSLIKQSDPGFYTDLSQMEVIKIHQNTTRSTHGAALGYTMIDIYYKEHFSNSSSCNPPNYADLSLDFKNSTNNVNGVTTSGTLLWDYHISLSKHHNFDGRLNCENTYTLPQNMELIKQP